MVHGKENTLDSVDQGKSKVKLDLRAKIYFWAHITSTLPPSATAVLVRQLLDPFQRVISEAFGHSFAVLRQKNDWNKTPFFKNKFFLILELNFTKFLTENLFSALQKHLKV